VPFGSGEPQFPGAALEHFGASRLDQRMRDVRAHLERGLAVEDLDVGALVNMMHRFTPFYHARVPSLKEGSQKIMAHSDLPKAGCGIAQRGGRDRGKGLVRPYDDGPGMHGYVARIAQYGCRCAI